MLEMACAIGMSASPVSIIPTRLGTSLPFGFDSGVHFLQGATERNGNRHNKHTHPHINRRLPIKRLQRRVHFSTHSDSLYFLSHRPVNQTKAPIYKLLLEPINCAEMLHTGSWLSQIQAMRQSPHARLDYIREYWPDREESMCDHFEMDPFEMDEEGEEQRKNADPGQKANPRHDEDDSLYKYTLLNQARSLYRARHSSEYLLVGEVAVYNLDYRKQVIIRYSTDSWKTHLQVSASYCSSIGTLRIDKFIFYLPIKFLPSEIVDLQLAICYVVGERTFWDNNNDQNYRFSCRVIEVNFEQGNEEEREEEKGQSEMKGEGEDDMEDKEDNDKDYWKDKKSFKQYKPSFSPLPPLQSLQLFPPQDPRLEKFCESKTVNLNDESHPISIPRRALYQNRTRIIANDLSLSPLNLSPHPASWDCQKQHPSCFTKKPSTLATNIEPDNTSLIVSLRDLRF